MKRINGNVLYTELGVSYIVFYDVKLISPVASRPRRKRSALWGGNFAQVSICRRQDECNYNSQKRERNVNIQISNRHNVGRGFIASAPERGEDDVRRRKSAVGNNNCSVSTTGNGKGAV